MKKLKTMNFFAIAAFSIMSCSVLFLPMAKGFNLTSGKQSVNTLIGLMFWLGLAVGIVAEVIAGAARKKLGENKYKLPGIISFFKNGESIVALLAFVAGAAGYFVIDLFVKSPQSTLQIAFLFLAIWGFSMHCVFDGKNYRFMRDTAITSKQEEETK